MSGWDTSSKPSWGPQDGPEDETQSSPASDLSSQDSASFAEESVPAGPPPEFFPQEFAKRTPGATLSRRDLPARDLPARDLPARDLPARDLPARDLPARDLPARDPAADARPPAPAESPWPEETRDEPPWQESAREEPVRDIPSPVAALSPDALDREHAARMDPALQDFFASGSTRTDVSRHGLPGPGLPGPDQQRYAENGHGEQGSRRNGVIGSNGSPWDGSAKRSKTGPLAAAMTGPMLAVKGAASLVTPKEDEPLLTKVLRFAGVGTVIIVAIVVGVYLLTHSGGGSPNATVTQQANPQPNLGGTKPTPTASAKATSTAKATTPAKKGGAATAKYVLSTPATAGGYPMGQDPHFLATATSTAQTILSAVSSGGGGTVKGSAVSAAYMLPTNNQVITFVGYHGTFDPAKVITAMRSFGTTDGTYRDAKAGGSIACANTTSSPSGGVCVWATATTIGITEFFSIDGPETLTASQHKGAADTEKLRASVETKKS